ncbi:MULTISPECIES: hypothetical protein [unclassified Paenibacillus]|uniref:hypothetical protein n=1 Tax=unclassified Paenibacillus TaxID=185978 RepID=UPI00301A250F
MEKLPLIIIICIIGAGIGFWIFNNPSGINNGLNSGATKINTKAGTFNYSGSTAPGTGQTMP